MDQVRYANMRKMFNTAAYVAKKERPYSDFPDLVELQKINGIKMGVTYSNDKACRDFIRHIAKDLREKKTKTPLHTSPVCSILLDSSADMSNTENANFYVRYFDPNQLVAKTEFFGIEKMSASDAATYHQAVKNILERHANGTETYKKLVGLGTDGASTMLGERTGLKARMRNDLSDIVAVHCVAHNLQLAIGDVCKEVVYLGANFQPTIVNICKFYSASPRREEQLSALSKILDECFLKIPVVHGVRWAASEASTLKAIIKDWVSLVTHLEELVHRNRSTANEGATAKGLLGHLRSERFIQTLHFMCDLLHVLKALSLQFQKDDLYLPDIPPLVSECIDDVDALAETDIPGGYMSRLAFEDDVENTKRKSFHGIKLDIPTAPRGAGATPPGFALDRGRIVNLTSEYLQKRFTSLLTSDVVQAASVLDPSSWPDTPDRFLKYGDQEMRAIGEHFFERLRRLETFSSSDGEGSDAEDSLPTKDVVVATLVREWLRFKKKKCKHLSSVGSFLSCAQFILRFPELFPTLGFIVKIIMVLPTSTACCERGFSALNRIKTKRRSCLEAESLEDCVTASLLLPPLDRYNVDGAIDSWFSSGKRLWRGRQGSSRSKRAKTTAPTSTESDMISDQSSEMSDE
jgi:hypothetical protein